MAKTLARRRPQGPTSGKGFVYFIRAGEGPVKIGWTRDVRQRLEHTQTHNHEALTLVGSIAGDTRTEAELHRCLRPFHIRGEWYAWAPEVESAVAGLIAAASLRGTAVYHATAQVRDRLRALAPSV